MALLLPADRFAAWLGAFLPGIADGEPAVLFEPAVVSDPSDGQIAHLHGLNASRAWCWRRIAESLHAADPRVELALWRRRGGTPTRRCRTWSATTTTSSTGWPPTRCCC